MTKQRSAFSRQSCIEQSRALCRKKTVARLLKGCATRHITLAILLREIKLRDKVARRNRRCDIGLKILVTGHPLVGPSSANTSDNSITITNPRIANRSIWQETRPQRTRQTLTTSGYAMMVHGHPKTPKNKSFWGVTQPPGVAEPIYSKGHN